MQPLSLTYSFFKNIFHFFLLPIALLIFSNAESQPVKVQVSYVAKFNHAGGDTIYYDPGRKLSWRDFKGTPVQNTFEAALTSSGYAYDAGVEFSDKNILLRIGVFSFFTKHNSWKRHNINDSFHLEHEQHHFDITYLGALNFIKEIQRTHFTVENYGQQLRAIFKKSYLENNQWQDQYDKETSHSVNEVQQTEWNKKINGLLANAAPGANR